jgi:hypothetical protein
VTVLQSNGDGAVFSQCKADISCYYPCIQSVQMNMFPGTVIVCDFISKIVTVTVIIVTNVAIVAHTVSVAGCC